MGYRALGAVFHIVDGEFDLSLLGDVRVLKERYTAQEDWITGALKTDGDRREKRAKGLLRSPAADRTQEPSNVHVPL